MKIVNIFRIIITNIFVLIVLSALFSAANSQFEKITYSLLVMIYIQVIMFSSQQMRQLSASDIVRNEQYGSLVQLMGRKIDLSETEEMKEKYKETQVISTVDMIFNLLYFFIAVFFLLTSLYG